MKGNILDKIIMVIVPSILYGSLAIYLIVKLILPFLGIDIYLPYIKLNGIFPEVVK